MALIDKPSASVEDLMKHVKGPDFPTGAIVVGRSGIRDAYRTGRGRIVMRARAHVEELRGGKNAIIVTELPYGVKKGGDGGVIAKIADLVREKVITEVSDLQDYSDKSGMRIQIELKREAIPQVALNKLFKHTALQTTFGFNAVALVDGVPRTLSLLEFVTHYLDFQKQVVTRRSQYELRQALARAHVLEGYLIALDNLDEVIALIRAADDADEARAGLVERFELSELQAQAILDLRLRALTGLERKRVEDEYKDLQERITELRTLLGDEAKIAALIREELLEIKEIYGKGDDRRTEIAAAEGDFELEDLIAEEDMVIAITRSGYIKRLPVTTYREQRRGGVGVMGMDLKDEDYIEHLFVASTHDYILFFSTKGKVYRLKVHELPLGARQSKGRAIVNLLPFTQDEQVKTVIRTRDFSEAKYLVLATRNGIVKKTEFAQYNTPLKSEGIIAVNLREGDELVDAFLTHGEDDVLLVSRKGQAIRFPNDAVRPMGRVTGGVIGMKLRSGDEVIAAMIADDTADLLVVTENGYGKRTRMSEYPRKGRGGMGVQTVKLTEARGKLAGAHARSRGLSGDADLDERPGDPHADRGHSPRRPRHARRDRDAPARARASRCRASHRSSRLRTAPTWSRMRTRSRRLWPTPTRTPPSSRRRASRAVSPPLLRAAAGSRGCRHRARCRPRRSAVARGRYATRARRGARDLRVRRARRRGAGEEPPPRGRGRPRGAGSRRHCSPGQRGRFASRRARPTPQGTARPRPLAPERARPLSRPPLRLRRRQRAAVRVARRAASACEGGWRRRPLPSLTRAWTYSNPSARADSARARHASATRASCSLDSSAIERAWCGHVYDHLLPLEGGIEVRHHAHLPVAVGRQPQRLGRSAILAPRAERAFVELTRVRRRLELRKRSRPPGAFGGDHHEAAGQRVAAQLGRRVAQLVSLSFSTCSRNGLSRSMGAGKTIVELLDAPISSNVWR